MTSVRPRLFLSSTVRDLAEYRGQVVHVGQRLGFDVVEMADFGPDPRSAAEVCKEKVQSCDVFVGLYAHRYGFTPDGFEGRSITELEYDWAVGRTPPVPVLAFAVTGDLAWPADLMDDDRSEIRRLVARLRARHVVQPLTTPLQLLEDLFVTLPRYHHTEQQGTRADVRRIELRSTPPEPYVVHQYSLLDTADVVGRHRELDLLDTWAESPAERILCLVAIGGTGKSALAWKWFHHETTRATGRMWWSFYEEDAGFDRFVSAALAYCSGLSSGDVASMSPVDRESALLRLLDREPFLIVLDGLERLLVTYSNLTAPEVPRDDPADRDPGDGPPGLHDLDGEERPHLRRTAQPHVGAFLRRLAGVRRGRVLVTTRLFPSALETSTGQPLPGVSTIRLTGLEPAEAVRLWHELGAAGTQDDLRRLFARIDHYPLLIRALAGEVAGYRPAPGDFERWQRDHPDFDPFTLPLVQARTHVLAHALGNLDSDSKEVLHTVAAFRVPVEYETLAALFIQADWPARRMDAALTDLEDRGLLGWDRITNQYDMHPVVRGVVWSGLDGVRQKAVYGTLDTHFSALLGGDRVTTLEQAQWAISRFTTLVGLDRLDSAVDLLRGPLSSFDFAAAGMNDVEIAMLLSLFTERLDRPPTVTRQSFVLGRLGDAYDAAGRLTEAFHLAQRAWGASADGAGEALSVATRAAKLGRLRASRDLLETLNTRAHDTYWREPPYKAQLAVSRAITGQERGMWQERKRLEAARGKAPSRTPDVDAQILLLAAKFQEVWALHGDLSWQSSGLPVVVHHEALIGLGEGKQSIPPLTTEVERTRASGRVEEQVHCQRLLSEAYRQAGELRRAEELLEDLTEPAARGPYRLIQADAALVRARVRRDRGDRSGATAAAVDAYRLAWCDGPPFAYHRALQDARVLLSELGADEPAL